MARYIEIIETEDGSERRYRVAFEFSADDVAAFSSGGGSGALETPTGDVDGVNATFVFTGPPKLMYRNGVEQHEFGTVVGNSFVYNAESIPATGFMRGFV